MEGEKLILELLIVKDKYKDVPVYTLETNIPMMIDDVIAELNRLTTVYQHDKHYVAIGKATEKAFKKISDTYSFWLSNYDEFTRIKSIEEFIVLAESEEKYVSKHHINTDILKPWINRMG